MTFVKDVLLKGPEYWGNILFSDEKRFCIDGPDGYCYYWHHLSKQKEVYALNTYSPGVIVWGAISKNGRKTFCFIEGNINALKYQKVLEDNLLPILVENESLFQQDNATPHKAKSTAEWIESRNIQTLDWPTKSLEL